MPKIEVLKPIGSVKQASDWRMNSGHFRMAPSRKHQPLSGHSDQSIRECGFFQLDDDDGFPVLTFFGQAEMHRSVVNSRASGVKAADSVEICMRNWRRQAVSLHEGV